MSATIVTIDGPAGAGKSTVSRELASRLGFRFLDTGAMYRAVALAAVERDVDFHDPDKLAALCDEITIELPEDRVLLDGKDVTAEIRSLHITSVTQYAADSPGVRQHLVALQRKLADGLDVVSEGRDQGTVAFPDAACKIFLTASPEERARRRVRDLEARGETASEAQVLADQTRRDKQDATRAVGPLIPAADAVHVITDGLSESEVVDRLEQLVRERIGSRGEGREARGEK